MLDYFAVLGVPRQFGLDAPGLEGLEQRFYRLSRENHPDRFTGESDSAQKNSLAKMSELNQAYRALKDPESRREHLLALEKVGASEAAKATQVPLELAEGWFELQDALMEDPAGALAKLAAFEADFAGLSEDRVNELRELENLADHARARGDLGAYRGYLTQIADSIRQQSYLSSMGRDIQRLKATWR